MASRGRDLKISILSDAEKFDLSRPADELEKLGTEAESAGRELKGIDRDTDVARKAIDRFGDETAQTAKKVDDAFDRIARSSRSNMREVDDDADRAGRGLDEFRDEADSTSREAAASFSDVESGLDAIQEIAANAFAGFGPAGKAAGLLAAVGMGVLFSGLQAASDKANEAKDKTLELAQALSEAGGSLSPNELTERIREWTYEIADNKSWWELWQKDNTTNLEKFGKKAQALGLDVQNFMRGMSGSDAQSAKESLDEINSLISESEAKMKDSTQRGASMARGQVSSEQRHLEALKNTKEALLDKAGQTEYAIELAAREAEALGSTARAEADRAEAADATKESIESVGEAALQSSIDQVKSIDDVIEAQEKALKAQRDFADNTKEVLDEVGQEGVEWAQQFGEHAPKMMQLLADAPKKKQAEIIRQYRAAGRTAGSATADGIYSQVGAVSRAGTAIYNAAEAAVRKQGGIEIDFTTKTSNITRETRLAMAEAQAYARRNPIVIRTRFAPSGQRPIRDVP